MLSKRVAPGTPYDPVAMEAMISGYNNYYSPGLEPARRGTVLLSLHHELGSREWALHFGGPRLVVEEGSPITWDAKLRSDYGTWSALMAGDADPISAWRDGRLQAEGDRDLLLYFMRTVPSQRAREHADRSGAQRS